MCYFVVERYSVCRCLYYKHSIDMCAAHETDGHPVQERTVLVGYACERHSGYRQDSLWSQGSRPSTTTSRSSSEPSQNVPKGVKITSSIALKALEEAHME